jgi:hypothetical protein
VAEGQTVAAGELRRRGLAARELVDHLAFGELDLADGQREVEFLGASTTSTVPKRISPTKGWLWV